MAIASVTPPDDIKRILPGADFADCFTIEAMGSDLDAWTAAEQMLAVPPAWVRVLLMVRDGIVRFFGIKTANDLARGHGERCGLFPILSKTSERVILGLDDRHLDFRIVVDAHRIDADAARVLVTTLVKRHNLFGRAYLFAIMPFHKLIVRALLARIVCRDGES